ncbi:AraC family transcriptional regulator [Pseudoruegeria sp. SK021]|uniref:helix-turn-helix domain-containing protein n=1 Tax=Pseudoruegeria sp. SK021 TaxID=1933035 RepID=UPI000A228A0A|nr:AraC family transcriptional regulator [Pseudoruegeria sp. SK021]OSP53936.1 hypothetical protein BV911_15145 [Pseudoruegeria sp. SK021]
MSHAIAVSHGAFGRAAVYNLDKPIITHAHREGHLIFHLSGAPASVTVGCQTVPNDLDYATAVSPWEPHSFNHTAGRSSLCLVLYIKPMWFLENSQSAEYALKFGSCQLAITPTVAGLVRRLTGNLMENEDHDAFDPLLFGVTRACFEQSWHSGQSRLDTVCTRSNDFRVRRSQRLMQERITEDLDMETVARSVGLSRPHFFKLFKQQFGVTPNVYMNTLRSEQAIDDLLSTGKSVTDIAFDLGFSSQASFTRFFSSNVGIAPSEYRRVAHVSGSGFPMMGQPARLSGMPI